MKTGLSIKKHDIPILKVSFDNISNPDLFSNLLPVSIRQRYLSAVLLIDVISAWMIIRSVPYKLFDLVNIVLVDSLRVRKVLRNVNGNDHLVDGAVGIRGYHSSSGKVHSLGRQVLSKTALLSLKSLTE